MKSATKNNGFKYCEYVLCYVDDVMAMSDEPQDTIDELKCEFKLCV